MAQSKLARKIVDRLVEMKELHPDVYDLDSAEIERLRPGHWQRSQGAWSWALYLKLKDGSDAYGHFGSQWSATECVKAKKWDLWKGTADISIFPVEEKEN